jgi:hypothetical protein
MRIGPAHPVIAHPVIVHPVIVHPVIVRLGQLGAGRIREAGAGCRRDELPSEPTGASAAALMSRSGSLAERSEGPVGSVGRHTLEQQSGQGADIVAPPHLGISRVPRPLRPPKAAEQRPTLLVEQDVSRFDGTVTDPEIVQVGGRRGEGGAETGDRGERLVAEADQIPARNQPQLEAIGWIAALHADQLHHSGMGHHSQHGGFVTELPAFRFRARSLVDQTRCGIKDHLHTARLP